MGISRAQFSASQNKWVDRPFTDIQAGTTQIKKVMIDGVEVWNLGAFSAATVTNQGSAPFGTTSGTYTFNVISSTGSGSGGQITGNVTFVRRLDSIVSIVDGGQGHAIGDILTLEMTTGGTWFTNPQIEVTAL